MNYIEINNLNSLLLTDTLSVSRTLVNLSTSIDFYYIETMCSETKIELISLLLITACIGKSAQFGFHI